ncbi:Uncharacterised protein [Legionella pneumophila]|nr:Uncharacterised protein [Legionella pneumophila]
MLLQIREKNNQKIQITTKFYFFISRITIYTQLLIANDSPQTLLMSA